MLPREINTVNYQGHYKEKEVQMKAALSSTITMNLIKHKVDMHKS